MGKIERPRHTQQALRAPTPWGLYAKRGGFAVLLVLALFIAYKEATRPQTAVKPIRLKAAQPQVIVIQQAAPQATLPTVPKESASQTVPPEPAPEVHEAVIESAVPPPVAPKPVVSAAPPPKPKTLRERMDDCLVLSGERDGSVSSPGGVQVLVTARNTCAEDFPGTERWFKIFAVSPNGSYIGAEEGRFQTTIQSYGRAETVIFVSCDPMSVSRFEFKPGP